MYRCVVLVALVAGCGDSKQQRPDAPMVDAADIDAADDASTDAATAPVTVTVYGTGQLEPNVPVQFHGPDGGFLGAVLTNSAGVATLTGFITGGAVTVPRAKNGRPTDEGAELTTIMAVTAGDHLTFGTAPYGASIGTVQLTAPPDVASSGYIVLFACNGAGGLGASATGSFQVDPNCVLPNATTFDALAYAGGQLSTGRTAYATLVDQPFAGSIPSLTGSASFGATVTTLAQHTVSVSTTGSEGREPGVWLFRDGIHYGMDRGSSYGGGAGGGTVSQTMKYADGFFDSAAPGVNINNGSQTLFVRSSTIATNAAPLTSTFDLDAEAPPAVTNVSMTNYASLSWTAPTWGCRDNPGAPDAVVFEASGTIPNDDEGIRYQWTILAPGSSTSPVTLPTLDPATIGTLWPRADFTEAFSRATFTSDSTVDYAAIRTSPSPFAITTAYPASNGTRCTSTN